MRPKIGKDKILQAAISLFAKQGFHSTSVSQIAEAAGVSKGLTYNYFKSKEDLLLAIINEATERMFAVAESMDRPESFETTLRSFLDDIGETLKTNKEFLSFQLGLLLQPELRPVIEEPLQRRADHLLQATKTMLSNAGLENVDLIARRLLAEIDGIGLHYLTIFKDYPLDGMLDQLFENYRTISR
ncbi:MAG: TetR/AcrR family transcriptional regulator [Kordiimonas sp.]